MKDLMMTHPRFKIKFLWSLLFLGLVLKGWHFTYHHKMLGFSLNKITSDFSYHPEWEVAAPSEREKKQLDEILSQPFYYLGAGSDAYAFVSRDGKTVLKFFRMKHQIFHLKDLWAGNLSEHRKDNLFSIYASHKLAFEDLKEEAGLIYLHLNKTHHLQKKVKLVDGIYRTHLVDLDRVEFVVQEKAELIFHRLKKLLKDKKRFNEALEEVRVLVKQRIEKGIADHDKAIAHNYGFVGNRAIQLDVGRVYRGHQPQDYERILERIDKWIDQQG